MKKIPELKLLERTVEDSRLRPEDKVKHQDAISKAVQSLDKASDKIFKAKSDDDVAKLLDSHNEAWVHADCEMQYIKGQLASMKKAQEKADKDKADKEKK